MAYKLYEESNIQAIADAIRKKNNSANTYRVSDMATAISDINITEEMNSIIMRTITSFESDTISSIGSQAFMNCMQLHTVKIPNAYTIGTQGFSNCRNLSTLIVPNVQLVEAGSLSSCHSLLTIDFPVATRLRNTCFQNCYNLRTLVLRLNSVAILETSTVFNNCYHFYGSVNEQYNPHGLKDGYIYVPREVINDYKNATNWSQLSSQFRELESYTIDGTTTGELDWSKIDGGAES